MNNKLGHDLERLIMILYEVTCIVKEKAIEKNFVKYMVTKHVKDVFNSGSFINSAFIKTEEVGVYKSSYFVKDKETLENYIEKHAPTLRKDVTNHFPNGAVEFKRSVSEFLFFKSI